MLRKLDPEYGAPYRTGEREARPRLQAVTAALLRARTNPVVPLDQRCIACMFVSTPRVRRSGRHASGKTEGMYNTQVAARGAGKAAREVRGREKSVCSRR